MKGRMRPYLPELTIRDYNTYQWYLRGVRRQLYTTYGLYYIPVSIKIFSVTKCGLS